MHRTHVQAEGHQTLRFEGDGIRAVRNRARGDSRITTSVFHLEGRLEYCAPDRETREQVCDARSPLPREGVDGIGERRP